MQNSVISKYVILSKLRFLTLCQLGCRRRNITLSTGLFQINKGPRSIPMVTSVLNQFSTQYKVTHRNLSTVSSENQTFDLLTFEKVCEETLESLTEYFEELVENAQHLKNTDVSYSSGVLTINFGSPYGTYVINRQTPNRQIWLSSPTSGPKRYDFVTTKQCWIYKHDGKSLHQLLQEEIPKIVEDNIDFSKCAHSFIA